jgi:hypothetical protein
VFWSTALITNRLSDPASPIMHFSTSLTSRALTTSSLMMGLLRSCVPSSGWVESSFVVVMGRPPISTPLWSTSLPLVEVPRIDFQRPFNHCRFVNKVRHISNFEADHLIHDSWLQTPFQLSCLQVFCGH